MRPARPRKVGSGTSCAPSSCWNAVQLQLVLQNHGALGDLIRLIGIEREILGHQPVFGSRQGQRFALAKGSSIVLASEARGVDERASPLVLGKVAFEDERISLQHEFIGWPGAAEYKVAMEAVVGQAEEVKESLSGLEGNPPALYSEVVD